MTDNNTTPILYYCSLSETFGEEYRCNKQCNQCKNQEEGIKENGGQVEIDFGTEVNESMGL